MRLADVRPSQVKAWTAELKAGGAAPSYVYPLHSRLPDPRRRRSRRVDPATRPAARLHRLDRPGVWSLHDTVPQHLAPAILLAP